MHLKYVRFQPGLLFIFLLLTACSTQTNTWSSRHYHELNTRYNIYFNGNEAYKKGLKKLNQSLVEDYSKPLPLYAVSNHSKAKAVASDMVKAIEKSEKAIKLHSIRVKPEKKPTTKTKVSKKLFYDQEEFNPFMDEVFMLMAKAQFLKADFESALATCNYIVRHFPSNTKRCQEARILEARAYTELKWYYDAENILNDLNNDNLHPALVSDFSAAYADLNIRENKLNEALPYLEIAVQKVRNKEDKQRWNFLLGQLYQLTDRNEKAFKTFAAIPLMSPPYEMELNARIRQSEVFPNTGSKKPLKQLIRLSKSRKNVDYIDQIEYAIGNVYFASHDTAKAIEHYQLSLAKTKNAGPQKVKTLLTLGNHFYATNQFIQAQPHFAELVTLLDKKDEIYPQIFKRSSILTEIAPPLISIHEEDSLQAIVKMSEAERMLVVDKLIANYKLKIKDQAKKIALQEASDRSKLNAQPNSNKNNNADVAPLNNDNNSSWYFYNSTTVLLGKRDFSGIWGNRPLADDWRRSKKTALFPEETLAKTDTIESASILSADRPAVDSLAKQPTTLVSQDLSKGADDPTNPNFYLKNLPFTEAQRTASNEKLADALLKAGTLFYEQMENSTLALQCFERLEKEFNPNKNLEQAWYSMYFLYKREAKDSLAEQARFKLVNNFPDSTLAKRLRVDNYFGNLIKMYQVQDTLFENAYDAFQNQRTDSLFARSIYANTQYPSSPLIPNFYFLEAMEYARIGKPEQFHNRLVQIKDSFPDNTLIPLVTKLLEYWDAGRRPVPSSGYLISFTSTSEPVMDEQTRMDSLAKSFTYLPNEPHYLLMAYDSTKIVANRLQFDVALYNFTNFLVRDYGLNLVKIGDLNTLMVSGFENAQDLTRYLSYLQFQGMTPEKKYPSLRLINVSESNLKILEEGVPLELYQLFFNKNYPAQ